MTLGLTTVLLTLKCICTGEKHYLDDEPKTSDIQAKPVKYNLLQFEKYPSNHPKLEAVWK